MNKKNIIVIILLLILIVFATVGLLNLNKSKDIVDVSGESLLLDNFSEEGFENINLNSKTLQRYNEKISKTKVCEVLVELKNIVFEGKVNYDELVKACAVYAHNFDYNFEKNAKAINRTVGEYNISKSYINTVAAKFLNLKIDYSLCTYDSKLNYVNPGYLEGGITDIYLARIDKILYNSSKDEYIIYIEELDPYSEEIVASGENMMRNLNQYSKKCVTNIVKIKYKKNDDNTYIVKNIKVN